MCVRIYVSVPHYHRPYINKTLFLKYSCDIGNDSRNDKYRKMFKTYGACVCAYARKLYTAILKYAAISSRQDILQDDDDVIKMFMHAS